MTVTILLEGTAKEGRMNDLKAWYREILPDTRNWDGCRHLEVLQNQDDPNNFVVREVWDSRGQYEQYFKWRQDTGIVDEYSKFLESGPTIRFLDDTDL